ncbi:phage terminase large subunit [Neisseria elongata]|uniref:phage terminase large subunit n=1 Tax=Neisseria elongata TaxID=495 RepID=UPI00131D7861|nr:phage terminase large subunit [Neisseria elongata]
MANETRAYYVQLRSAWSKKTLLEKICFEMGLPPARTAAGCLDLICEQLAASQRPLILDEADYLVTHSGMVELVRDIYEGSQAPLMLVGEEMLPTKLKKFERFHGRVLAWVPAQPVDLADAEELAKVYAPDLTFERDALSYLVDLAHGSVRRVTVNLVNLLELANQQGLDKKMRGMVHGAFRPDLAILDDIENDEMVRNPDQRDKLEMWLKQTVLPLGAVGTKFDVIYIGTILHYDSVLSRTLNNPFWSTRKFKAMKCWPDRMDLWDRWEELYRNDGAAVAEAFYQAHKDEMERGAQTSWAARGVLALMKIRARDGHATFDSEYQNDPVSGEDAPFAENIKYWSELPDDLVYYGALDPSLGKAGAGRDPSAILVGGYQKSTGRLFVTVAQVKKRLPDLIIEDVIRIQKEARVKPVLWVVETVQFQEFLKDELIKRGARSGVHIPVRGIKPSADKMLRIETLQPHMANGLILLNPDQKTLISQLRHFPKADHDDGPDALHMLWMAATSGRATENMRAYEIPVMPFTI